MIVAEGAPPERAMVKQVGLLPAGCQPWNRDVCVATCNRFAYCATLAVYIYELDERYQQFRLLSIMSEHKKTVSAVAWNPKKPQLFASSSFDNKIVVWDVGRQKAVAVLENTRVPPVTLGWCLMYGEGVSFLHGRGPLYMWDYQGGEANKGVTNIRDTTFSSDVTAFRWHPRQHEKVAFGHQDGTVSFSIVGSKSQKHVLRPEVDDDDDGAACDGVVALEWDPLSADYLLVCNAYSGLRMLDAAAHTVINTFTLPSAATKIKTLSWMANAPGMFVTGDTHTGILRVWNVSKSSPVETIRVKKNGFHALQVICDSCSAKSSGHIGDYSRAGTLSSNSQAQTPTTVTSSHFALPPARIVCTFLDGGVGLYDLGRRKWDFLRDEGHIETIFDCKFSPESANVLATSSFDGTIKLWDINSFTCTHTSHGNEGIIYCISWAPSDLNCIVAGTSKNGIFIWDINKGRVVKRFMEHGKQPVFTVAWNQKDSKRIMSTGGDGTCVIRQVDGELFQKYKHPGPVYGCDWSPHNKDMLATGCEDKNVRVYYTATTSSQPLKLFSGHTSKIFHVKWSPLKENLLCSGSDDGCIRVWDYSQEACLVTMCGHGGPVRGLNWSTEIPWLVVSGSWDATMKIWDLRDGTCLDTISDHGADIYGLTSHPSRPFILASSSRDSTVRLWSLTTLIYPIEMNILAGRPWQHTLATVDAGLCAGGAPVLTGRGSRDLKLEVDEYPADARNRTLKLFSKFFMAPAGTDNLWELVSVVKGLDDTLLSHSYGRGIVHVKHMAKFCASRAQQLEMARLTKSGGGIGTPSRDEKLREAALLHMKTGNLRRYCELMVELGAWERALAIAPGVSHQYWNDLATRYAKALVSEDNDDAGPYCTAIGDTGMLTGFYISRGQIPDAVLAAQVCCEGLMPGPAPTPLSAGSQQNGWQQHTDKDAALLQECMEELASWHLSNGSPVLSACCYLAIDNTQLAMSRLIQGHELELAVSMGVVLKGLEQYTAVALEMLSRRCERHGDWELALDLLDQVPDNKVLRARCCARWAGDDNTLNTMHKHAELPAVAECLREAETLKQAGDVTQCVMYYLLSSSPELGLELGLQKIKATIKRSDWCVDDVFGLLQLLGCIRTDVLQVHSKKGELLVLSAYVGALVAIRRGYNLVVHALFQHARSLLQQHGYVDVGLTEAQVQSECIAWSAVNLAQPRAPVNLELIPAEFKPGYVQLLERAGEEGSPACVGPACVLSSHLPSHSDIHLSCLTGDRVQGLAYFLEDGRSAVSLNEALMWAKVNPFSPLGSGVRINPY